MARTTIFPALVTPYKVTDGRKAGGGERHLQGEGAVAEEEGGGGGGGGGMRCGNRSQ